MHRRGRTFSPVAVALLAGAAIDGLPEDLARRLFGLWSNACVRLVEQRGWHEPRRYAPATSRGAVFAVQEGVLEMPTARGRAYRCEPTID